MRKFNCPQCNIPNFYIMNDAGERRLVYVMEVSENCRKMKANRWMGLTWIRFIVWDALVR